MSMPDEAAFDCRATAALLRSMGTLVWASHAGALVAVSYRVWIPLPAWGSGPTGPAHDRGEQRLARNLAVAVVVQLAATAVVLSRNV